MREFSEAQKEIRFKIEQAQTKVQLLDGIRPHTPAQAERYEELLSEVDDLQEAEYGQSLRDEVKCELEKVHQYEKELKSLQKSLVKLPVGSKHWIETIYLMSVKADKLAECRNIIDDLNLRMSMMQDD